MFIWQEPDVSLIAPDGPVNIFTLLRQTDRLERPQRAHLWRVSRAAAGAPGTAAAATRPGSGNRLLRMEFPRNPHAANAPPTAAAPAGISPTERSSISAIPAAEAEPRPQGATKPPASPAPLAPGATPARHDPAAELWPEGDWAPEPGAGQGVWRRSPIAGVIGASAEAPVQPIEIAPTPPIEPLEAPATDNAFNTLEWPVSDPPRRLGWARPSRCSARCAVVAAVGALSRCRADGRDRAVLHGRAADAGHMGPVVDARARLRGRDRHGRVVPRVRLGRDSPATASRAGHGIRSRGRCRNGVPDDTAARLRPIAPDLGLAVVQVAVVYYGLSCALWGLGGTLGAFLVGALLLPPAVPGSAAQPGSASLPTQGPSRLPRSCCCTRSARSARG